MSARKKERKIFNPITLTFSTLDWWRLTSYSHLLLLFQSPHWLAVWILFPIGRTHYRMAKMANGRSKPAADCAVRLPLGREEAHDWAALALPLQVCLDREVVQDSDWQDKFCHCQNMWRGNKACWGEVRGCALIHLRAGNSAHSRFGAAACIACASRSRPLHSSENTPPTHSTGPRPLLAPPPLSVGDVDQSPVTNTERQRERTSKRE